MESEQEGAFEEDPPVETTSVARLHMSVQDSKIIAPTVFCSGCGWKGSCRSRPGDDSRGAATRPYLDYGGGGR